MKTVSFIKQNHGQVAIIVLLISAVLLTMGLSAAKTTVTDVKTDADEELLKSAFNTAESGINNYLKSDGSSTSYSDGAGGNANVSTTDIGGGSTLSSDGVIESNNNQLFWLVNHDTTGNIGNAYATGTVNISVESAFAGALKIDYFYLESGVYKIKRFGCNYSSSNPIVDGFSSTTTSCQSITLTPNALLLSITPIGGNTKISISGASNFPVQGQIITSVGTVNSNIKTQVKTRYVYKVPLFMFESITAKNIVH